MHGLYVRTKKAYVGESLIAGRFCTRQGPVSVRGLPVVIDVVKNGAFIIAFVVPFKITFVYLGSLRFHDAVLPISVMPVRLSIVRLIIVARWTNVLFLHVVLLLMNLHVILIDKSFIAHAARVLRLVFVPMKILQVNAQTGGFQ